MAVFELKNSLTFDNDRGNFSHDEVLWEKRIFDSAGDEMDPKKEFIV